MSTDQLQQLGPALAGRYVIEHEVGRGGMATVYLADDLKHHRKVAIKVLRPELGSVLGADRFTREIRIAAGLNHPHILPLHDSGEAGGLLFYVMPFVRGESLRQKLDREGELPVEEAVRIARQVAAALEHAHSHGLIHRDIKPENVLLHEGEAMVTDFGIALGTDVSDRLTGTGLMLGTPAYMSPEQAAGERALDARSDIYSLGCMLYELLTGEPPYTGGNAQAVIVKRFTDPVPSVRRLRATVPAPVEQAIKKALAKAPADRYPSAAAFAEALIARSAANDTPSVAVLPFLNLSTDQENEFFADGITEDVISQLSKIGALRVISRTSVMAFKRRDRTLQEVAAALNVGTLVEGSVRRAGNRVRIVAQLVDTADDRHLWTETYDRELTDIFAIQTDVALQIAGALKAELSPAERSRLRKEPTTNVRAYQSYLKGRHCLLRWTQGGVDLALKHIDEAIALDPEYAMAYVLKAFAYNEMALGVAGTFQPDEAFRRAKHAIHRALEIDGNLAEAHGILGHLKFSSDFDWAGAEAEFRRALELDPNSGDVYDFYGLLLSSLERYDEALAVQRRAYELDPLAHRMDVTTTLLRAGRYDEALAAIDRVIEVEPNVALARMTRGWAYYLSGRREEGLSELRTAAEMAPDSTLYLAQYGQALGLMGRTEEAREVLRRLPLVAGDRYLSPYHLAYVHTGLGDYDRAMDCLERACDERAGGIFGIRGSFLFAPLRSHPRFQALLRKMNLA